MDDSSLNQALTLLAVLAHPDDESFGMGGTLALYARPGVAVPLGWATPGWVGEAGPPPSAGAPALRTPTLTILPPPGPPLWLSPLPATQPSTRERILLSSRKNFTTTPFHA